VEPLYAFLLASRRFTRGESRVVLVSDDDAWLLWLSWAVQVHTPRALPCSAILVADTPGEYMHNPDLWPTQGGLGVLSPKEFREDRWLNDELGKAWGVIQLFKPRPFPEVPLHEHLVGFEDARRGIRPILKVLTLAHVSYENLLGEPLPEVLEWDTRLQLKPEHKGLVFPGLRGDVALFANLLGSSLIASVQGPFRSRHMDVPIVCASRLPDGQGRGVTMVGVAHVGGGPNKTAGKSAGLKYAALLPKTYDDLLAWAWTHAHLSMGQIDLLLTPFRNDDKEQTDG